MTAYFQLISRHRRIIYELAFHQVVQHNAGALGGFAWEIIHPLSRVLIFWLVFAVGFKATGPAGTPFILYFIVGMLPWITFSGVLSGGTDAVVANPHLVKKTVFPLEVIPVVYLAASLVRHLILLVIVMGVMLYYQREFSWSFFQLPYYFGGMALLLLGLTWTTSALNVFNRDIGHLARVLTEIWFWATPVVWVLDLVPETYRWLFKLNPMYFVIDGYRDCLLNHGGLWRDGWMAAYFWTIATLTVLFGTYVFRKLKPLFADEIP